MTCIGKGALQLTGQHLQRSRQARASHRPTPAGARPLTTRAVRQPDIVIGTHSSLTSARWRLVADLRPAIVAGPRSSVPHSRRQPVRDDLHLSLTRASHGCLQVHVVDPHIVHRQPKLELVGCPRSSPARARSRR